MRLLSTSAAAILCIVHFARCSPLTFILPADSEECFYTLTPDTDCSISYYYSLPHSSSSSSSSSNKIDYKVYGPGSEGHPITSGEGETQGHWTFTGDHMGEYTFCFNNPSAYYEQVVDLEISYRCDRRGPVDVRREERARVRDVRQNEIVSDALHESIDDKLDVIDRELYVLERNMGYYMTRNERNHYTVASTAKRITNFSVCGILLVVGMSLSQIALLKWVFAESRKQRV